MRPAGLGVLNAILDNPLTQGWSDLVATRVVTPLERIGMDDEDYRMRLAAAASNLIPKGQVAEAPQELKERVILAAMAKHQGDREMAEEIASVLDGGPVNQDDVAGMFARIRPEDPEGVLDGLSRQQMIELESQLLRGNAEAHALTDGGTVAVNILGNPLAAYGAVLGGGALGTMGAMELARQIQAQQAAAGGADEAAAAEEVKKAAAQRKAAAEKEQQG